MAKIVGNPKVQFNLTFSVDEQEARALDALAEYGDDAFIEVFYTKLGRAYMEEHEAGLRRFLKSIRDAMPTLLDRADGARKIFEGL